VHKEKPINV
jgi:hypothetical protein